MRKSNWITSNDGKSQTNVSTGVTKNLNQGRVTSVSQPSTTATNTTSANTNTANNTSLSKMNSGVSSGNYYNKNPWSDSYTSTGNYTIGSTQGQNIANGMKVGQLYSASDGSNWYKNNDGSISVMGNNGVYTSNAYSSSLGGNPYGGVVNYNGTTIDLGKDYQADINNYANSGDYVSASETEALRNAKINYINSINPANKYVATDNYNYQSFADVPSNFTTAKVGNETYRQSNGKYYDSNDNFLGDGYNASTGSFKYSNRTDAENAARDYIANQIGLQGSGLTSDDYISSTGAIDEGLIKAFQNGTVDDYNKQVASAKQEYEELMSILDLGYSGNEYDTIDKVIPVDGTYNATTDSLSGNKTSSQSQYEKSTADYLDYLGKQLGKGNTSIY